MGVDYQQTLNPDNGLARNVRILRPDGTKSLLWTVAIDIGQERLDGPDAGIDMSWVGAAGIRRAPTLARAAGEAVERSALIPRTGLESGAGLPWAPSGACWADISATSELRSYAATRFEPDGSQMRVAVPAGAVDFPPTAGTASELFDPGPSGTAAGVDLPTTINSAAKEIIERSAAMKGWDLPESALRFNLLGNGFGAAVRDLVSAASRAGVEVHLVLLHEPSGHPVWMAVAIDPIKKVVGAGLGLERDLSQGVLRAVQESLQIRSLLIDLKEFEGEKSVALPITTEMERARYWAADASIDEITEWLTNIPQGTVFPGAPEVPDSRLIALEQQNYWRNSLPGYTVVDLTPRLPLPVRDMGWCVVKTFCDTLQPLRMSDALAWNILGGSGPGYSRPHPFI